jgi:hypothetical protein
MRLPTVPQLLLAFSSVSLSSSISAQDVAEKELAQPNATVKNLKSPAVATTLGDGSVILFDSRLERLVRADFSNGSIKELMKQGDDDDQFGEFTRFWSWRGDTVAAFDGQRNRAVMITPDGPTPRILPFGPGAGRRGGGPPAAGRGRGGGGGGGRGGPPGGGRGGRGGGGPMGPFNPQHLLPDGRLYGYGSAPPAEQRPGFAPPRTSLPILLRSPQGIDTVARFLPKQPNKLRVVMPNSALGTIAHEKHTHDISEFIASDTWFVYKDGTVGVVRGADYHLDTYGPADQRTKGEPLPYPKVKITDGEKKRSLDEFKKVAEGMVDNMGYSVQVIEGWPWPDAHPPFRHDIPVIVDDLDRAWLRVRCASTDKAECYDVIDREGKRVMRVRLPEKTTLLAVTNGHAYTSFQEKADKAVLQRHPLN